MKLPQLPGYEYEELLGEGPCGWVFRCSWNFGMEQRAVKVLKSQATNRALVGGCLRALAEGKIKHPAFPEIYDLDLTGRPIAYAMPLYGRKNGTHGKWNSQSLENFCGSLPAEHSIVLIDQMADGLACLHRNGIFHTALKPANMFVTNKPDGSYQIKIADPGMGYSAGVQFLKMGDNGFYASLEQLETGDFTGGQGMAWDVYSFGVVAYRLLTGKLPRLEARYEQYRQNADAIGGMTAVAHGELMEGAESFIKWLKLERAVTWADQPQTDKEASRRFVIEKCLALDPTERFTDMREVREALVQSDHQLQMNRLSLTAKENENKGTKRTKLWKMAAMVALSLFGVSLVGTSIVWGIGKVNAGKKEEALTTVKRTAEERNAAYEQVLKERDNSAAEIQESLENAKDSQQFLLGKASHARHVVRLIQANSDKFFEVILNNRDSDVPGFEIQRAHALADARKYYETLIDAYEEDPEFTLSMADAHRYLGEIYNELGLFQAARESLGKASGYYENLLQVDSSNVGITRGMARVQQLQAAVSEKIGTNPQTIEFLENSNRLLVKLGEIDPSEQQRISLDLAGNYLEIANAYQHSGSAPQALQYAKASGDTYLNLREKSPANDRVLAGMARAFGLTGKLLASEGKAKESIASYQQGADLYAEAIKLNGAADQYQLGLGQCMGRIGLAENDKAKLQAAATVLAEVVPANIYKSEYQTVLAEVFGALAQKLRDGGEEATAIELAQKAVSILKPIVNGSTIVPVEVRFVYAKTLADLANLQGDSGEFEASRKPLTEAIVILDALVEADNANTDFRRTLAHSRGMAGFASDKAGDTNSARQHYMVAKNEWAHVIAEFPNDSSAAEAAKWTDEQLKRLQ